LCTGDREQLKAQGGEANQELEPESQSGKEMKATVMLAGSRECVQSLAMQRMQELRSRYGMAAVKTRLAGTQHRVQANAECDSPP